MPAYTLLVLNWNGRAILPGMLGSVIEQVAGAGGKLLVFDNGSDDGSDRDALELMGQNPLFSLVRSPVNLGFAAGVNEAMRVVDTDVTVIANSDTLFSEGSLTNLVEGLLRHPRAGLAGPRLLWPDGSLQQSMRDFPFPGRIIIEHLPVLRRSSYRHDPHETEMRCDWLVGAVMAVRTAALRAVGGFDEDYFFYHEETDLQYRLKKAGWETWFIPSSQVVHLEGASAKRKFGEDVYLRYIPAKIRFLSKHAGAGSRAAFRVWMALLMLGRMAAGSVNPALRRRDGRFRAVYCMKALKLLFGNTERNNA
jgi:hypothetical protein